MCVLFQKAVQICMFYLQRRTSWGYLLSKKTSEPVSIHSLFSQEISFIHWVKITFCRTKKLKLTSRNYLFVWCPVGSYFCMQLYYNCTEFRWSQLQHSSCRIFDWSCETNTGIVALAFCKKAFWTAQLGHQLSKLICDTCLPS